MYCYYKRKGAVVPELHQCVDCETTPEAENSVEQSSVPALQDELPLQKLSLHESTDSVLEVGTKMHLLDKELIHVQPGAFEHLANHQAA